MQRRKVDSQRERRLLTALIVSKRFLAQSAGVLDLSLIDAPHFRQIATWCIEYWQEYQDAPGSHIEDIYHSWAEDNENLDQVDAIHDFLETLAGQHETEDQVNVPYLLDELSEFLAKRKIQRLQENLEHALLHGDVREAEEALTSYRKVEIGATAGFDPLNEDGPWDAAFAEMMEPLISFGGAAGKFFNSALTRDSLIAIQAPEKTGKTFWCVEFVIQALRSRRKVAFFNTGDHTKPQILRRLGVRWASRPMFEWQTGELLVPEKIELDEEEECGYRVVSKKVARPHVLTQRAVKRARKKFMRGCGIKPGSQHLRVSCHSNSSINVQAIDALLDQWRQEHDFIADVIVVDYADILAPEDASQQARDQVNDTWKALRRLSQERHALVIAPTQADAQSYTQDMTLQTMKNFSEDKRKLGHVTGMLALNQTPDEKDFGGMRVNWIVLRESPFNIQRALYVGTCFGLGRALCCSTM